MSEHFKAQPAHDDTDLTDDLSIHAEREDEGKQDNSLEDGDQAVVSVPMDVHIAFYSSITKKQVKNHVIAYAEKNFNSLNDVTYQIIKHEDGYLFEIQQGGDGLGYVSDYLESGYDDALIVTSDNVYRISSSIHGGLRLVKLTNEDVREVTRNPESFNILEGKDKLKDLRTKGFAFFVFATVMVLVATLSLAASAGIKYVLLDKEEVVFFTNMDKTFPHEFIPEMQNEIYQMDMSSEYFKNFVYDSSRFGDRKWTLEKGSILGSSAVSGERQQLEGEE